VAIASDRQATNAAFLPLVNPTSVQTSVHSVTKVSIIGQDILLGVSGIPAIGDDYEAAIRREGQSFSSRNYELATRKLKDEIRGIVNKNAETADLLSKAIGPGPAFAQCTIECLLAANFKEGPRLIQITQQGQFDVAKPELPIRAIGSGQLQADPFLVFLKNTFWPDRLPTVEEGLLAACWAVDYAIEVGAAHVGKDLNAFFLSRNGQNKVRAKKATDDQITNHRDFIAVARERLRDLADPRGATEADAEQVPTRGNGN
jgi:20S proteasome alpha/beta subunit